MPLSEHEQRLLEQLEQQLHADDPKLAQSFGNNDAGRLSTRNLLVGAVILLLGLLGVLGGVATHLIILGVAGFIVMGAGVYLALSRTRRKTDDDVSETTGRSEKKKSSFISTLEQKWDERNRPE